MRDAVLDDLEHIIHIYKTVIDADKPRVDYYIKKFILHKTIKVIEEDNKVVAAYIYNINRFINHYTKETAKKRIVWLEQIMVLPEYQNKHYGKQLMEDLLSQRYKDYRLVCKPHLETYYNQFGFVVENKGIHKGDIYLLMTKSI